VEQIPGAINFIDVHTPKEHPRKLGGQGGELIVEELASKAAAEERRGVSGASVVVVGSGQRWTWRFLLA
jgi:hypothetical protein